MFPTDEDDFVPGGYEGGPITTAYCDTCRLFHAGDVTCAVAKSAVEASIMVAGEVVGVEEIGDVDRPALDRALALRGLKLEPVLGHVFDGVRHWRVEAVAA